MKNALLILSSFLFVASAFADLPPLEEVVVNGKEYYADAKYMTVHTFDQDTAGVSNCYDGCARKWPPVIAPDGELKAPLSVITRKDGVHQLALSNQPLYTFARDQKKGDILGEGLGGVWHLVPTVN